MNRFVKHNMLLIAVFAVSGVVAVALMIYALIEYVKMAQVIGTIDQLRGEIETIGKQTPRPVDENILCVSDSDRRVPAELGQESQASSCLRKGTPLASRVAHPDTPGSLEGNTEGPGTASSEPPLPS